MYLWRDPTVANRLANAIARAIIFVTRFPPVSKLRPVLHPTKLLVKKWSPSHAL